MSLEIRATTDLFVEAARQARWNPELRTVLERIERELPPRCSAAFHDLMQAPSSTRKRHALYQALEAGWERLGRNLRRLMEDLESRLANGAGGASKPNDTMSDEVPPPEDPDEIDPKVKVGRNIEDLPEDSEKKPVPVELGASGPSSAEPGGELTGYFAAYEPRLRDDVEKVLEGLQGQADTHLGQQTCLWKLGTRVAVHVSGKHIEAEEPRQEFTWQGGRSLVPFDLAVSPQAPEGTTRIAFSVAIDEVILARLRLPLRIGGGAAGKKSQARGKAAASAFASYSSRDRARVADRIAAVEISAGLKVFLDCFKLRPNQDWEKRLFNEIRSRDLFLLFWSPSAKQSKWVERELDAALQSHRLIQLHPLKYNFPPPERLAHLHANDPYLAIYELEKDRMD